jgi:ketosteroid isomerase-like protein
LPVRCGSRCFDPDAKNPRRVTICYSDDLFAYDVGPPCQYVGAAAFQKAWQGFPGMFKGPINAEVNDLVINSDGEIAYSRSVHHVSGTTNESKPFDSTFRITDVYRKSHGKWVIVQEHISLPPDVARWCALDKNEASEMGAGTYRCDLQGYWQANS